MQVTEYCHQFLRNYIREGDLCVDATAGNGGDTEFLCRLVGRSGKVYAFDIQKAAIDRTADRLKTCGLLDRLILIRDSHEKMAEYVRGHAAAVMFNLGYLPGTDHSIATKPDTTLRAVETGLSLLQKSGVMSLCIYSGGDTGYSEKKALLEYLRNLDQRKWLVIVSEYYNRKNDPPIPVFIIRLK